MDDQTESSEVEVESEEKNQSYILLLSNKILDISLKLTTLTPPWDKVSKTFNSKTFDIENPKKKDEMAFVINYQELLALLLNNTSCLYKYLLHNFFNSSSTTNKFELNGIKELLKNDQGLTIIVGDEYKYINLLNRALFFLELTLMQNTKLSTLWETYYKTHQISLRLALFVETCKLRCIVYLFSLKENKKRQEMKYRTPNLSQDFTRVLSYNLAIPITSLNTNHANESDTLWIKITKTHYNVDDTVSIKPIPRLIIPNRSSVLTKHSQTYQQISQNRLPSNVSNSSQSNNQDNYKDAIAIEEKPKPILLYNTFELDESFRFFMFRLKTVNYHIEIENYLKLLILRASFIVTFKNFGCEGLNFYNEHSNPFLFTDYKNFNEFVYRLDIRIYNILEKLNRLNLFRKLYEIRTDPNEEFYTSVTNFLMSYCEKWSTTQMAKSISDRIRKRYMALIVPPGDEMWMKIAFPTDPINATSIMDKMHENVYESLSREANTTISKILEERSSSIVKLHDEIVLEAVEGIFFNSADLTNGYSFMDTFYFSEEYEDRLINRNIPLEKPFLALLFSRIVVHFQCDKIKNIGGTLVKKSQLEIYDEDNITKLRPIILSAIITDITIYHSIARLLQLLKLHYPGDDGTIYLLRKLHMAMFKNN